MASNVPDEVDFEVTPEVKVSAAKKAVSNTKGDIVGLLASEIQTLLDSARNKNLVGDSLLGSRGNKSDKDLASEYLDTCMQLFPVDSSKFDDMLEVFRSIDFFRIVADKIHEAYVAEIHRVPKSSISYPGGLSETTNQRPGLPHGLSLDSAQTNKELQSYEEVESLITSEQDDTESKLLKNQDAIRQIKDNIQGTESAEEMSSQAEVSSEIYQKYIEKLKKKKIEMKALKDEHQQKISKLKGEVKDKDQENEELKSANTEYEESVKKLGVEIVELKKNNDFEIFRMKTDKDSEISKLKVEIAKLEGAHAKEVSSLKEEISSLKQRETEKEKEAADKRILELEEELKHSKSSQKNQESNSIVELKEAHDKEVAILKEENLLLKQRETEREKQDLQKKNEEQAKMIQELQERLKHTDTSGQKEQEFSNGRANETGEPSIKDQTLH